MFSLDEIAQQEPDQQQQDQQMPDEQQPGVNLSTRLQIFCTNVFFRCTCS